MVCGERRDIEDEIANRILSDISEENSLIGSADEFDQLIREKNKWVNLFLVENLTKVKFKIE